MAELIEYPEIKKLYKYRFFHDRELDNLKNKKIWVSKPASFNDPFDCKITLDESYTNEEFSRFYTYMGTILNDSIKNVVSFLCQAYENGEIKEEVRASLRQKIKEMNERNLNRGVYSLSSDNSNLLLWAHYADSHKGFCIEFDRSLDNSLGNIEITFPVHYDIDFPIITLPSIYESNTEMSAFVAPVRTKSIDWVYEKEWRILYDKGGLEEDLPSPITSIIFGCRMPVDHRDQLFEVMSEYQGVSFKEAQIVDGRYELQVFDI